MHGSSCMPNIGENGEHGEQDCFETQTFQKFMSFPWKRVNDFIAVSAHFQAKKVAN